MAARHAALFASLAASLVLATGSGCLCSFPGELLDPYACEGPEDYCADPFVCIDGFCVVPAMGTDGGTDAGMGIDSGTDSATDSGGTDSAVDSGPLACAPGAPFCDADGRTLHTCNAMGTGPEPGMDTTCGFLCMVDACRYVSNEADATMEACDATAPPLTPPAGATLTYSPLMITCAPDCGDGSTTTIMASAGATMTDPVTVCVSTLDIPATVTLSPAPGLSLPGLILLVAGDATVAGDIVFSGEAGAFLALGIGGPGGGEGGAPPAANSDPGGPGGGPGGGGGGLRGAGSQRAGGGGGGSYFGSGGPGGMGDTSAGGAAGATYGSAGLRPLEGGSGGGGGGDGLGGVGGGGGGGGGGALQISARGTLALSGNILVNGGDGGEGPVATNHGAGAGGSGGGVLLEAPTVSISGTIVVDGGAGGASTGTGGTGATGGSVDGTPGMTAPFGGGGGGGGGAGRARINSALGACAGISPAGACTAGSLRTTPGP